MPPRQASRVDGNQPSKVRYHSRPAQLDVGAVVRVTNLSPQQLAQLEEYIEQQLQGKRYLS